MAYLQYAVCVSLPKMWWLFSTSTYTPFTFCFFIFIANIHRDTGIWRCITYSIFFIHIKKIKTLHDWHEAVGWLNITEVTATYSHKLWKKKKEITELGCITAWGICVAHFPEYVCTLLSPLAQLGAQPKTQRVVVVRRHTPRGTGIPKSPLKQPAFKTTVY